MGKNTKSNKGWILPAAAGVLAAAALIVVLFVPKNRSKDPGGSVSEPVRENSSEPTAEAVSAMDENGHLIIYADKLSSERISFIWVSDDSRIELLTRVGDDGMVKAALGTCQSCNGSPRAYYTQEGDKLKCNNCGLTFPISVLDNPGGGCHPIMLDETLLQYQGNDLVMDLSSLLAYEYLFSKVVNH